ncbi:MAG: TolC family protein, partial [Succinivibrio sp.]
MKRLSFCIALALSLTSCTAFFTDYKSPEFPTVDSFANAAKYTGGAIENDFYKNFNDEKLNFVIEKALDHNYDMRTAYINVEKALLNVDITDTNYHPTADASLGSNSKRALDRHDSSVKSSNGKFSLSYQLDLFGKLKSQSDEALHNFEATAYDYLAMRLTIIETTAKAYWQYSYAKEAVVLGEEDLVDSEKRLKLVENKYLAGAADSLDLD